MCFIIEIINREYIFFLASCHVNFKGLKMVDAWRPPSFLGKLVVQHVRFDDVINVPISPFGLISS